MNYDIFLLIYISLLLFLGTIILYTVERPIKVYVINRRKKRGSCLWIGRRRVRCCPVWSNPARRPPPAVPIFRITHLNPGCINLANRLCCHAEEQPHSPANQDPYSMTTPGSARRKKRADLAFVVTCGSGMEQLVAAEISEQGGKNPVITPGAVAWEGKSGGGLPPLPLVPLRLPGPAPDRPVRSSGPGDPVPAGDARSTGTPISLRARPLPSSPP